MPATLLTDQPLTLTNAPDLADIATMGALLQQHGLAVDHHKSDRVIVLSGRLQSDLAVLP